VLPGALPLGRNSPQKCPSGLYAEQLSGSPLHCAWHHKRAVPVAHRGDSTKADIGLWRTAPAPEVDVPIPPMRWPPMGSHIYFVTHLKENEDFYNADGELLFVPQEGRLRSSRSSAPGRSSPARSRLSRAA
jgi:homogentisate 1,2-dioxygenase